MAEITDKLHSSIPCTDEAIEITKKLRLLKLFTLYTPIPLKILYNKSIDLYNGGTNGCPYAKK